MWDLNIIIQNNLTDQQRALLHLLDKAKSEIQNGKYKEFDKTIKEMQKERKDNKGDK